MSRDPKYFARIAGIFIGCLRDSALPSLYNIYIVEDRPVRSLFLLPKEVVPVYFSVAAHDNQASGNVC